VKQKKLIDILKEEFGLDEKQAAAYILSGKALVDEKPVTKAGIKIDLKSEVRIKDQKKYVSRGAYKLITALDSIDFQISEKVCADFGCSTGGFTEVLLERNAKKVYAVDCGNNLLDYKLRINPKVTVMENKKISDLTNEDFNDKIDLAVMDISFASATPSIKHILNNLSVTKLITLIKPQFEFNRLKKKLDLVDEFKGVIKNTDDIEKIINYIKDELIELNFSVYRIIKSRIKGQKGNQEYLFYIGKQ
jgi:23S rRNA (cytidine1920-2'-O)/16S rRNA (cytidine1409-2'-O)-methyltransferase